MMYGETFDNLKDALDWQVTIIRKVLDEGGYFRVVDITDQVDFDTKVRWWRVIIRTVEFEHVST